MKKQFSYSQALLALAIAFLGYSLIKFTTHVPAILSVIEKTTHTVEGVSPKIDDIVAEIALVRVEVGKVRAVVSKQTPAILSQVEASLPVVQQVVAESEQYSQRLPEILKKIASIEQQVALLQTSMPAILKRIDAVVQTTKDTTTEISLWRPHSNKYLEEIALSRGYIPQYLTRIENTVIDAKTVGSEASSGLVSGFFKGVISLPFEMVAGLTGIVDADSRSAKYLTAEDVALMQEKVIVLLNDNNQKKTIWQNVKSGNRGTIIKGTTMTRNKQDCLNVTFNNHFGNEKETLKELMCINEKGLWKVI